MTLDPDPLTVPEPEPPVVSRGVRVWVLLAIAVLVAGLLALVAAWRVG